MEIIREKEYDTVMKETVEPYLKKHGKSGYISSYDGIGKIHVMRYLAEEPKGVIVICHGYTESAPKYDELAYYFLQAGFHVYLPEHCGHGLSYRLTKDPSLVHIDNWKRYVRDFLHVCEYIRKKHPDLNLNLFAHSMGGAIGGIAAAWKPEWFYRVILNSPMIRPRTANIPWVISASVSGVQCLLGKGGEYVPGQHPYDASETFETSASTSRPRFNRFNNLRKMHKYMQVCAASYGWLFASAEMSWYLKGIAWKLYRAPMLLIQAEQDDYVCGNEIYRFARHVQRYEGTSCEFLYLPGTKHETYSCDDKTMQHYVNRILKFLISKQIHLFFCARCMLRSNNFYVASVCISQAFFDFFLKKNKKRP